MNWIIGYKLSSYCRTSSLAWFYSVHSLREQHHEVSHIQKVTARTTDDYIVCKASQHLKIVN